MTEHVAVLGAGLMGCCAALALADRGFRVTVFDKRRQPLMEASSHGEGKLHLGFVYAADRSFRTARLMHRGASVFLETLSRWAPRHDLEALRSHRFNYAVHRDSMLSVQDIEQHFERISVEWRGGKDWAANRLLPRAETEALYDPALVQAAFSTGEFAMDTPRVAELVRRAVDAEPRITMQAEIDVARVARTARGFEIHGARQDAPIVDGPYATVANCLWANRAAVDVASGYAARAPFLNRSKVGISMHCTGELPAGLVSTTFVLGPFGDIVTWPNGRVYLSWYPAGMVGTTREPGLLDWRTIRAGIDQPSVIRATLDALTELCPAVGALETTPAPDMDVDGGIIYALGETDIDDPASHLHERHEVGLVASYDRYHSVDTGKYTLAPLLACELADRIAGGNTHGG